MDRALVEYQNEIVMPFNEQWETFLFLTNLKVVMQDVVEDGKERLFTREHNSKCGKMPL